ncbi:FHA domain-containing protein FhaB/FipA [Kribbella sp. CA-294648]|uniref:FHA domain-containing protein FhaB/FipA n=1 Tax=Kribbella sp. CA-294648 TaxID=3239948 RepID=UPI003D943EF1
MSELTLTLIKLGFLALLWMFVLAVLSVIRSDLFGAKVDARAIAPAASPQPNGRTPKPAKPAKKRKGLPGSVTIADGPQAGVGATLGDAPVVIGRGSDCQIRLDDDYSSTRHARVFPSEGEWWVEDLGSTNGTYLDGQRVTRPVPAEIGGSIRIGRTTLNIAK